MQSDDISAMDIKGIALAVFLAGIGESTLHFANMAMPYTAIITAIKMTKRMF